MVYRVSNENANTARLKIVAGLTGTAWFLIKMRCAAPHQIGVKNPRGSDHIVAVTVAVAVLNGEFLTNVMMSSGLMTTTKMETGIETETETEIVIEVERDIPPTGETMIDDDRRLHILNAE